MPSRSAANFSASSQRTFFGKKRDAMYTAVASDMLSSVKFWQRKRASCSPLGGCGSSERTPALDRIPRASAAILCLSSAISTPVALAVAVVRYTWRTILPMPEPRS